MAGGPRAYSHPRSPFRKAAGRVPVDSIPEPPALPPSTPNSREDLAYPSFAPVPACLGAGCGPLFCETVMPAFLERARLPSDRRVGLRDSFTVTVTEANTELVLRKWAG